MVVHVFGKQRQTLAYKVSEPHDSQPWIHNETVWRGWGMGVGRRKLVVKIG